jgi:next-to-BRCA1 protein 1
MVVPPPPLLSPNVAHSVPPLPSLPPMQPVSQDDNRQQSPPPTVNDAETPVQRLFRHRGLRSVASAPVLGPGVPIPPVPPLPPPPRPVSLYGDIQVPDSPYVMRPNRRVTTVSEELDELYSAEAPVPVDGEDVNETPRGTCCDVERGKQEISNVIRTFKTDVDRILSQSLGMDPTDVWGATSTERQSNPATPLPSLNSDSTTTNQGPPTEPTRSVEPSSPAEPVIHANVFCDMCREVIIGVRHKCLDCAGLAHPPSLCALKFTDGLCVDFDLCSLCLAIQPQNIGLHSKSHSLFAIEEPGGLWVHTIFSGEGTPEVPEPPAQKEEPTEFRNINSSGSDDRVERAPPPVVKLAAHNATCDLCDSTIKGDRFVSHASCTVRYSYTSCRNASTAQISIHARHAIRSYPHNTHVTALLAYVIRKT